MRTYVHFMNHTYAYSRNDRKINFRMVSAQHFINETPGTDLRNAALRFTFIQKLWVIEQQFLCFGHSQSVFLFRCQTALWYSLPGFMFSERGTGSDMRIMLSATRLMQRSSLQMHISLSLSSTLQEHLNCVTPAKIAQPSKESGRGTLGAIIGRSFRNFSVSVGRVVYETSKNTLF